MRALMRSINFPSHLATMGKEAEGSDTLLSSFKNSTVLRDLERMLVMLEQPEEERDGSAWTHGDEDAPVDVDGILASSEARKWRIPEGLDNRGTSLPVGGSPSRPTMTSSGQEQNPRRTKECGVQTSMTDEPGTSPVTTHLASSASRTSISSPLQLPHNAWPLLDIYFSYTQCWFPILEKHDILRTSFQYTDNDVFVSCAAPGSGDHAALWAALALASLQDRGTHGTLERDDHPSQPYSPSQLYKIARELIPTELGPYQVGHVQALLILSLIKCGQQAWNTAWMLIGHALRIAQTLGLGQSSATAPADATGQNQQHGRAKHIFLGCFVLETLIAQQTSQCPSLRRSDLLKVGVINEDGLEEWHPWEDQTSLRQTQSSRASVQRGPLHSLSVFNRLVSLVSVLNDFCCLKQEPDVSSSRLESIELQLQRWASDLPKTYRNDLQSHPVKLGSPHIFNLDMTYQSIASTLNLHVACLGDDRSIQETHRWPRVVDSSKRLLQLLQVYIENYSFPATLPIFGMILACCVSCAIPREIGFDVGSALRDELLTHSSHLRQVWTMSDSPNRAEFAGQRNQNQRMMESSRTLQRPDNRSNSNLAPQPSVSTEIRQPVPHEGQFPMHVGPPPPSDSFISTPWLRASQTVDDGTSLLPTPTPSLTTVGGTSDMPTQPCQMDSSLNTRIPHPTSVPSKYQHGSTIIPDLTSPYAASGNYHSSYQDPSLGVSPFVDMEGYGPPQRQQRIAPDLDALFDELASLDGAER